MSGTGAARGAGVDPCPILHRAMYTVRAVRRLNGVVPAMDFIAALKDEDRAKVKRLIQWFAEKGAIENREKFKKLTQELFEFKSFQVRLGAFFGPGKELFLTHGFIKKANNWPAAQITTALAIKREHEDYHV